VSVERVTSFAEVLEAADRLPLDDQEALAEVLRRRIVEHRREELAAEVQQAQQEFEQGHCRPSSADELMAVNNVGNGFYSSAVNRAYYAVFYAASRLESSWRQ